MLWTSTPIMHGYRPYWLRLVGVVFHNIWKAPYWLLLGESVCLVAVAVWFPIHILWFVNVFVGPKR